MTRLTPLLSIVVVFALGCGDDDTVTRGRDAGGGVDVGPGVDAGPGTDSGGGGVDVGPGVDTGPAGEDAGPMEGCEGGPLDEPLPDCTLTPPPSTGDLAQDCVNRINQFRWECQCLPPLERWREGEACATEHAEYDSTRGAHAGFRDRICNPGGRGQNECPGYRSNDQVIGLCLQQMWDEGPGEPFSEHGHYINMTNPAHSRVACGFYTAPDGRVWAVQNFN